MLMMKLVRNWIVNVRHLYVNHSPNLNLLSHLVITFDFINFPHQEFIIIQGFILSIPVIIIIVKDYNYYLLYALLFLWISLF